MPDLFDGEVVPADGLEPDSKYDFMGWVGRHPPGERATAIARAVKDALQAEGVSKFGSLGFCYGGRIAFNLAFTGDVDVVAVAHPSLLQIPEDLHVSMRTSS